MTVQEKERTDDLNIEIKSFLEELEEFIEEKEVKELEIDENDLTIKDPQQAEYFLKKVKDLREEKQQIEEAAKTALENYKQKVEEWKEKSISPLDSAINYFEDLLKAYAEYKLEGSSKKSIKLIEGTIGFKAQQPKYHYIDEKALTEFLENNYPDLVRYKPEPNKKDLKKKAEIEGEQLYLDGKPVEGIVVEERGEAFYVN